MCAPVIKGDKSYTVGPLKNSESYTSALSTSALSTSEIFYGLTKPEIFYGLVNSAAHMALRSRRFSTALRNLGQLSTPSKGPDRSSPV